MSDEIKVHVKMYDEAKDFDRGKREQESSAVQYQVRIAEIEIYFGEFDASLAGDDELRKELQNFFQHLADERFGAESVVVKVELRAGSLIIAIVIAIGTGGYQFFKDYEQLHKGVQIFTDDVKAAKKKIEAIIRKYKDKPARK
jgi:hypothetical protein